MIQGGVPAATDGSLSFLIGCSEDDRDLQSRITSVLTTMGSPDKFFWCGCLGAGLAAKISNNYLSCSILVGIAEAMAIGIRSGIEPGLLHRVIHHSSGQSWMLDNVQPVPGVLPHVPSSNNYKLGFKTQMMIKDVSLGVDAGEAVGIEPSIARAALEVYQQAAKNPKCIVREQDLICLQCSKSLTPVAGSGWVVSISTHHRHLRGTARRGNCNYNCRHRSIVDRHRNESRQNMTAFDDIYSPEPLDRSWMMDMTSRFSLSRITGVPFHNSRSLL